MEKKKMRVEKNVSLEMISWDVYVNVLLKFLPLCDVLKTSYYNRSFRNFEMNSFEFWEENVKRVLNLRVIPKWLVEKVHNLSWRQVFYKIIKELSFVSFEGSRKNLEGIKSAKILEDGHTLLKRGACFMNHLHEITDIMVTRLGKLVTSSKTGEIIFWDSHTLEKVADNKDKNNEREQGAGRVFPLILKNDPILLGKRSRFWRTRNTVDRVACLVDAGGYAIWSYDGSKDQLSLERMGDWEVAEETIDSNNSRKTKSIGGSPSRAVQVGSWKFAFLTSGIINPRMNRLFNQEKVTFVDFGDGGRVLSPGEGKDGWMEERTFDIIGENFRNDKIEFFSRKIVVLDGHMKVIMVDFDSKEVVHEIKFDSEVCNLKAFGERYLFIATKDQTVTVFDYAQRKKVQFERLPDDVYWKCVHEVSGLTESEILAKHETLAAQLEKKRAEKLKEWEAGREEREQRHDEWVKGAARRKEERRRRKEELERVKEGLAEGRINIKELPLREQLKCIEPGYMSEDTDDEKYEFKDERFSFWSEEYDFWRDVKEEYPKELIEELKSDRIALQCVHNEVTGEDYLIAIFFPSLNPMICTFAIAPKEEKVIHLKHMDGMPTKKYFVEKKTEEGDVRLEEFFYQPKIIKRMFSPQEIVSGIGGFQIILDCGSRFIVYHLMMRKVVGFIPARCVNQWPIASLPGGRICTVSRKNINEIVVYNWKL